MAKRASSRVNTFFIVALITCTGVGLYTVYQLTRKAPEQVKEPILTVETRQPEVAPVPEAAPKQVTPAQFVRRTVRKNKVVIFSKSYCPYCKKAKAALDQYIPGGYTAVELDLREDGAELQDTLLQVTGGRSVPRVFVGGKFLGGGDDTARLAESGELREILEAAGAL